jgi:hypothetical protein
MPNILRQKIGGSPFQWLDFMWRSLNSFLFVLRYLDQVGWFTKWLSLHWIQNEAQGGIFSPTPYDSVKQNLLGNKDTNAETIQIHSLSKTILWGSRNPQLEAAWLFLAPVPSTPDHKALWSIVASPGPQMSMVLIFYSEWTRSLHRGSQFSPFCF